MYRSKANGWFQHGHFMLTDMLWNLSAFMTACLIRHPNLVNIRESFFFMLIFLYPVFHVFAALFFSSYKDIMKRGYAKELKATLVHNIIVLVMIVMLMFIIKRTDVMSRIIVGLTFIFSCVLMYISRIVIKKILLKRREKKGTGGIMFLVMTEEASAVRTVSTVLSNNTHALGIAGVIVMDADMVGQSVCGVPVVANAATWKEYVLENVVDEIMIDTADFESAGDKIKYINTIGATAHLVLRMGDYDAPSKVVQDLNGFAVVSSSINMASPRQRMLKRAMDIGFGLLGAAAVIVLTVFIGPMIYFEDRGPIFFTQKRVGRNGRIFRIIKYRTMYTDAEQRKAELMKDNEMSGNMFKMKNDPRITRIGKFLRKTSLDELPQAFNILAGSMSVVGTRPPTLDEFRQYEPHHKVRLGITPGLTGLWQVSGRSEITDFEEIVKLDEEYISNWDLGLDLKIIFKTFIVVLKREGAE